MVICLERGADLHMAQLMPLPLTVSCCSKIQIGFTFLVPAHLGSPGHRAVKRGVNGVYVAVAVYVANGCRRRCHNGGTCLESGLCQCRPDYYGRRCHIGLYIARLKKISYDSL